jgi:hypothetical protein
VLSVVLATLSGCGTRSKVVVYTFETPPTSWEVVSNSGGGELFSVRDHHLDLAGERSFVEPTAFSSMSGSVDLAFLDAGGRGASRRARSSALAGIVLEHASDPRLFCLALTPRDRGKSRVYRGKNPFVPRGGAGWRERSNAWPTGFSRLEFEVRGGSVTFRVDGKEIDGGELASVPPSGKPGWRVGIFSSGARTRWNNFIVGESGSAAFSASSHIDWGDSTTITSLEREFLLEAKRFESRPSRSGVFAVVAPLTGALAACRAIGDDSRYDSLSSAAAKTAAQLRGAARRVGEEELLVKAFGSIARTTSERRTILGVSDQEFVQRAKKAEAAGRWTEALVYYTVALEVESDAATEASVRELMSKLPTPSYSLAVDDSRANKKSLVSSMRFRERVTASYGGLRRGGDNRGISIRLQIQKADIDSEKETATRRVSVADGSARIPEAERKELERLKTSRDDDLREAIANAHVLKASAQVLGGDTLEYVRPFTLDGKKYDLHATDGKRLAKDYARYSQLKQKWDRLAGRMHIEQISAKRTTVSIAFRARLDVFYDGKVIVDGEMFDVYRGLELWEHPAVPDKGIARSKPSNAEFQAAVAWVRERVLRRFDRLISTANILSKLSRDQRLTFLIGVARGTRGSRDELSLRWAIQQEFGIESVLRDSVARRLLD